MHVRYMFTDSALRAKSLIREALYAYTASPSRGQKHTERLRALLRRPSVSGYPTPAVTVGTPHGT